MDKDRIYGHAELAMLYFKNIQPKSAANHYPRRPFGRPGNLENQITTAAGKAFLLFDFPDPARKGQFMPTYTDK
ncbi:hypothetical protein [uncultured Parabacteroides sp.]|uniref:hypothetical protein n=1 Tax=uncultured Parabacteroides sp. TaxID=512312 RepID=UPI0026113EBB|nr:hypothetical protein [uncultured Parabacteroides sp.]